jgi:ribosome-binding protein aMBF1 (putative translation factor)
MERSAKLRYLQGMSTSPIESPNRGLSAAVAAELRAALGRRGWSQRQLAQRMHRDAVWLNRRISTTAPVNMTLEEVSEMADALGVEAEGIVVAALRACRDSNPKPSDP